MAVSFGVSIDCSRVDKILRNVASKKSQELLTEKVLQDTSPFVPYRTGSLYKSGHRSAIDSITWTEDYARYVYHGTSRQQAQPWFEEAKDWCLQGWIDYAGKALLM